LNKVVNDFENYSSQYIHNIKDPNEKIKIYSHIRFHVKSCLSLFSKINNSNGTEIELLQKHIKNDTYAIHNQFIRESFRQSNNVKFTPDLVDFQDLQYTIAKRALVYLDIRINILKDSLDSKDKKPKPIHSAPPVNLFQDKIKTNLTVPQIAFLFKCLYEENDILEEKNKTALRQSIASCFTSKRRENISAESIRKKFNSFDDETILFWIDRLQHMLQFAQDELNNN
jgi:hypothetical protein